MYVFTIWMRMCGSPSLSRTVGQWRKSRTFPEPLLPGKSPSNLWEVTHFRCETVTDEEGNWEWQRVHKVCICVCVGWVCLFTGWQKRKCGLPIRLKKGHLTLTRILRNACAWQHLSFEIKGSHCSIHPPRQSGGAKNMTGAGSHRKVRQRFSVYVVSTCF